jgi:histidinol-phosphatase
LYYARKGEGAVGPKGPLRVSGYRTLREGMMLFGGLDAWRRAGMWPAVERLVAASGRQRGFGDYLGHLFVARGLAEAMVEMDLKPWDMAPLKILLEEAGGRFTDRENRPGIYNGWGIATNGLVHDEVLRLINGEPQ